MRMSNVYITGADVNSNANYDPTTKPDHTLTLSLMLGLIINLSLTLPIVGLWLHIVHAGFLKRGHGINAILLITAISAKLLRASGACVKRRPVGCWVWPLR